MPILGYKCALFRVSLVFTKHYLKTTKSEVTMMRQLHHNNHNARGPQDAYWRNLSSGPTTQLLTFAFFTFVFACNGAAQEFVPFVIPAKPNPNSLIAIDSFEAISVDSGRLVTQSGVRALLSQWRAHPALGCKPFVWGKSAQPRRCPVCCRASGYGRCQHRPMSPYGLCSVASWAMERPGRQNHYSRGP
jgi:hypothetical protein